MEETFRETSPVPTSPHLRDGSCSLHVHAIRNANHMPFVNSAILGIAAASEKHGHTVANLEREDIRAQRLDHTRSLQAQDLACARWSGVRW